MCSSKRYRGCLIFLTVLIPLTALFLFSTAYALPQYRVDGGADRRRDKPFQRTDINSLVEHLYPAMGGSVRADRYEMDSLQIYTSSEQASDHGSLIEVDSIPEDIAATTIDIWNGTSQVFGQLGTPQQWINILGNVTDTVGITSLDYSLNGVLGSPTLSIGPDGRRLVDPGDFNVELDKDDLIDGMNTIVITATNGVDLQSTETVMVEYQSSNIWPLPYSIDWASVSDPQEVLQIVDGRWTFSGAGIRTSQVDYDRVLAIGDLEWDDYEVTVPVTIHAIDESAYGTLSIGPGLGVNLRWLGHTNNPVVCPQPHCGWEPKGSSNWYEWKETQDDILWIFATPPSGGINTTALQFAIGNTYWYKARVETNETGSLYRLKVWEDGFAEPPTWTLERQAGSSNLANGSFLLIAHHVDATFGDVTVLPTGEYTLSINQTGNGTVAKVPDQPTYTYGDVVTLTATADPGWIFTGWSGGVTGTENPIQITIEGDTSVTATFVQEEYTLQVTSVGNGVVAKYPDQPTYLYGDVVTLTATADPGWIFTNWSGGATGTENPTQITIEGNTSVTATFTQEEYTLQVTPVGNGIVAKDPDQLTYFFGDVVTLTATADPGWIFTGWSGGATGTENPKEITIEGDTSVTATFIPEGEYVLDVGVVGNGTVGKDPDQTSYQSGEIVTLTATPATGWRFVDWSGGATGTENPLEITIEGNTNVTATFTQEDYTLQISLVGNGGVAKVPDQPSYHYGDVVALTATAGPGWTFTGWSGDVTGNENPTPITIEGNTSVTAIFRARILLPMIIKGE